MRTVPRREGQACAAKAEDAGCAFVLSDAGPASGAFAQCGAPAQPGSPYCRPHHALCHLPSGSVAERRQLREIAALAKVVGGRQGRSALGPPEMLLRRLKRIEKAFSRPSRS